MNTTQLRLGERPKSYARKRSLSMARSIKALFSLANNAWNVKELMQ